MFESVTDGIAVTDLNGVIIETNQRTAEIHGFGSKDELRGKSAFDLVVPHDQQKAMMNLQEILAKGSVETTELISP